jgi:DNA modification methylase
MRTVWDIPNNKQSDESKFGKHPTQKPLRIIDRMIRLSSKKGDLIMTPFSGSGSECVAAILAERNYLGYEIDGEYFENSVTRIAKSETSKQLSLIETD